jgi:hypothetical protein
MRSIFNYWIRQIVNDLPIILATLISSLALLTFIAMYIPPPESIRTSIEDEVRDLSEAIVNASFIEKIYIIYTRNAFANTLFILPFFINIVMYISTMVTTSWALSISATILEETLGIPTYLSIVSLMLMPHTYLELFSYSLSLIASFKLTLNLIRKHTNKEIIYSFIITILLSYSILLISAIVEVALINI